METAAVRHHGKMGCSTQVNAGCKGKAATWKPDSKLNRKLIHKCIRTYAAGILEACCGKWEKLSYRKIFKNSNILKWVTKHLEMKPFWSNKRLPQWQPEALFCAC
jgi:hypothetical protein